MFRVFPLFNLEGTEEKKLKKIRTLNGGLAQLGERLPCKQEVTSSTLVFSIFKWKIIKKDSFL